MSDPALSFGAAAGEYDRYRPRYPSDAVAWTTGRTTPGLVVDLGAGTGILTRALLALGHQVVPVEPDEQMRGQLAVGTPGVSPLAGSAEEIPLPDAAADAVLAGQAYHWFDRDRAHPEVARVLRPGGTFGVLWNLRDESEPWLAELSTIAYEAGDGRDTPTAGRNGATQDHEPDVRSFGDRFGPVERAEFRHSTPHTVDSLVAMMATRSYYLTAGPRRRQEIVRAVRDLAAGHPDLAGKESFELPYRTVCFRARRR
jgi:SAM-dependent methyltransferase